MATTTITTVSRPEPPESATASAPRTPQASSPKPAQPQAKSLAVPKDTVTISNAAQAALRQAIGTQAQQAQEAVVGEASTQQATPPQAGQIHRT